MATCVCMVECWQGKTTHEEELVAAWGKPPYTLKVHAGPRLGRYDWLDPDNRDHHDYLRGRLRARWVIVTLMLQPRTMAHAVVLVEATPHGFRYLDPAEPSEVLEISEDDFVQKWTGQVVIPDSRPD
ncbi:MAG TPA: hypothetical protein VLS89_14200 [Candidatus Nanopelagicales bacterium]|nr:hypothetical protein [Candidatus Nanopelagicales bacterium]